MRDRIGTIENRISIRSIATDPRAKAAVHSSKTLQVKGVESIEISDLIWFDPPLDDEARKKVTQFLVDPLLQSAAWGIESSSASHTVEIAFLPGVTDSEAREVQRAALVLGIDVKAVATGRRYEIHGPVSADGVEMLTRRLLANSVVERWAINDFVDPPIGVLASVLEHAGSADLSLHSAVAGMEKVSAVGGKNIL